MHKHKHIKGWWDFIKCLYFLDLEPICYGILEYIMLPVYLNFYICYSYSNNLNFAWLENRSVIMPVADFWT